ncbi:Conserved_hypothetical protein [Hexamita inflata]|uniref:Uncharacterized protein n=1 Tax=Hexamita inflata TaxID=28002 RepID=A0AA86TXE4_9EUKA|nr:Conserved hypothetical protein [Hexamita inflata]
MFNIILSLQLNCFTANVSLLLSAQTRTATFTAQVLKDGSQENLICQQLDSSVYNAKIILGAHTYSQNTLKFSASSDLQIVFTCSQAGPTGCSAAFSATSASFQLLFPSSNTLIEDSIPDMKIDSYNRINCITKQYLSADDTQWTIQVVGKDTGCKIPIDQTKNALITLTGYPDFIFTKSISLVGINSLTDLFQRVIFNCHNDYTGTMERTCKRAVTFLINELNSFAELTIDLPGKIPDNSSLSYSRESAYSLNIKLLTISSSFVQQFDCFSSQKVTMANDILKLALPFNSSRVNCLKPLSEFIGDFDRTEYIIQIQSDLNFLISTIVIFNFTNVIPDFSSNSPYLPCPSESSGMESCIKKISQVRAMPAQYGFIVRTFYKGDTMVRTVTNDLTTAFGRVVSAAANLSRTQLCFNTTDYFKDKTSLQVRMQVVSGTPYYSEVGHAYVLEVYGQIQYPNPERIYCMKYTLNDSQTIAYDHMLGSHDLTGILFFYSSTTAMTSITMATEGTHTDYLIVAAVVAVIICFAWFVVTLYIELRPERTIQENYLKSQMKEKDEKKDTLKNIPKMQRQGTVDINEDEKEEDSQEFKVVKV